MKKLLLTSALLTLLSCVDSPTSSMAPSAVDVGDTVKQDTTLLFSDTSVVTDSVDDAITSPDSVYFTAEIENCAIKESTTVYVYLYELAKWDSKTEVRDSTWVVMDSVVITDTSEGIYSEVSLAIEYTGTQQYYTVNIEWQHWHETPKTYIAQMEQIKTAESYSDRSNPFYMPWGYNRHGDILGIYNYVYRHNKDVEYGYADWLEID